VKQGYIFLLMHVVQINTSEGEEKCLIKYMDSKIYDRFHQSHSFDQPVSKQHDSSYFICLAHV